MGPRRALFAALLAAPLAVLGVCGPIAAFAPPPAVCEAPPADGCCPRSDSPACPRSPEPGRCASCGAAACAFGETERVRSPERAPASAAARAAAPARVLVRTSAAIFEASLTASPPRHLLLATFRN